LSIDAVVLQIQDMVEFGNCQKWQKCTDFTQIHPFLALLRSRLTAGAPRLLATLLQKLRDEHAIFV